MNKPLVRFHIFMIIVLFGSYLLHNFLFDSQHLTLMYAINFLIATIVYWLVYLLRNIQKDYLGFYFLAGTFLKIVVFLLVILPLIKEDNVVSKVEFLSFFVPYTLSLIIEVVFLIDIIKIR